ncbi:MAG: hypothetical protein DPW09_16445 [Anaerolineae bacterium]|nr:PD40 domain-containing protein [Anaerolineales bacterium]MCQ3975030.1 hypothetical protein [Anaerolineae bacterium]
MVKIHHKVSLLAIITFLLALILNPEQVQAQWPPFRFNLTPVYESSKITYNITFTNRANWSMADVTITVPLPEGTRFLEANAQSNVEVTFNGQEITFFTAVVHESVKNASFVVEVTDPARNVFTTHAWIVWKGDQPGDYLTEDISFDKTQPPTSWAATSASRLALRVTAAVTAGIITYNIYPIKTDQLRMWDVKINMPIPEGATFLSAETSASFVADFDGREVSYFTTELDNQTEPEPLILKVSTAGVSRSSVVTHAWASWKNVGRRTGRLIPAQEETRSGDIVAQPDIPQYVLSDRVGDVPFSEYDLTSIAIGTDSTGLKIMLYTAGDFGPVGKILVYSLYIDQDCRPDTGQERDGLGRDYLIRYRHDTGRANFNAWDMTQQSWTWLQPLQFSRSADEKQLIILIPNNLLANSHQFCWQATATYTDPTFTVNPPADVTALTRYEAVTNASTVTALIAPSDTFALVESAEDDPNISPEESGNAGPAPSAAGMKGKLAVPLDNGYARYNVYIFSLPDGQEVWQIPNARQPNFRFDGQRLLINHEGGGIENVFEYNLLDGVEKQVGNWPEDSYPFYDSWGNRLVFGNAKLIIGANGNRQPFIFVQCGLMPPYQETEARCRDIPSLGVLVPAGQMGEIQGTHPVWTSNDMIAYKGCNTWAGSRLCGIYSVPSASTKGFSDGFIPRQLTQDTSDIPSDTKGNLIAFTSHRDGNWEAYVMDLNGDGVRNLSNSPDSDDGLPTISPDGDWVAFVSNRGGQWAIWAVPAAGGEAQKLFNLPTNTPWGTGDRDWVNERISWGP